MSKKNYKDLELVKPGFANGIFHVIVAIMMIASGVGAVKALKANSINMATLETALTAIKGGEVKTYLSKLIS